VSTDVRPPVDVEREAARHLPARTQRAFDAIDTRVTRFLENYGITLLRVALALVFIWFGALKLAGRSPIEDLVRDTACFVPGDVAVYVLGLWEIVIGLGLLLPVALRAVLALFCLQMLGTLLVLVVHPGAVFQDDNPLLLTITGEFVIKNLVLIAAGLVIGSTVRRRGATQAEKRRVQAG